MGSSVDGIKKGGGPSGSAVGEGAIIPLARDGARKK